MMDAYDVNAKGGDPRIAQPEMVPYLDPSLSKKERQKDFDERVEKRENPTPADDFNPQTHDPFAGVPERALKPLQRQVPPKRLPTMGILPDKIRETQMVGMYMSKQELYLLIAHLSNRLTDEEEAHTVTRAVVDSLEESVNELRRQIALITQQKGK